MIINRLPLVLKQKGLSIRELSRQTGITYTTIRAVYHGGRRSVHLDVMDSLCRVLEIQPADIFKYYPDESAALAADGLIEENIKRTSEQKEIGSTNGRIQISKEEKGEQGWHVW